MRIITNIIFLNDSTTSKSQYVEYIKTLKKYLEKYEAKEDVIYIYKSNKTKYKILNKENINITEEYFNEYIKETPVLNYEDFLFDALLSINPKKIIIKCNIPVNIKKTISKLFSIANL